jgi:pyruvate/2-oxoglutarate/acetoin dehydrogenase E1 component
MFNYAAELRRTMTWLAAQPSTVFVGQALRNGSFMSATFDDCPDGKLCELPVFENTNVGMAIGMSLSGCIPIVVIPRWNFLILAADAIVNHLDKIAEYSLYRPRVIIRTAVGRTRPLSPGIQHTSNFCDAFRSMCRSIHIVELREPKSVFEEYAKAYSRNDGVSTILSEYGDLYHQ